MCGHKRHMAGDCQARSDTMSNKVGRMKLMGQAQEKIFQI